VSTGIANDDASFITHSIEKLIALHVVLPARSTFIESGGSGIDYSKAEDPDWSAVQPVTSSFRPLFEDRSGADINCSGMHASKDPSSCAFAATWQAAELIPTFYNIVARSVPRDSFRRQNTEASWLETVFVALAELAYSSTRESSGDTSGFIPLLEQLFIVVRARKINLSLHTFLTHAAYTGLLKGKESPEEVRWSLTTLLIDLGVDIFLPNSGFKDSGRLLDALFQSLQHIRSDSADKETYQTVKEKVVVPLLRAFAAARDLSTFVELWHEQLRQVEVVRKSGSSIFLLGAYSVWEDDDLATAYREAIKTTLSDTHLKGQIETAIPTIITSSGLISHAPESYAHFIILEAGSRAWGHNGLPGLRIDLVTSLVEATSKSISRAEKLHWFWRLWRLARNLIPISLKTPFNTPNDLAKEFEHTALEVMSMGNIYSGHGKKVNSNTWREALEACRFLLQITKDLHHDATAQLESTLSSFLQNVCSLLNFLSKENPSDWNGRVQDLDTLAQLGIAYAECVLEFPHMWATLTSENVKQFVGYLSVLAQPVEHIENTTTADAASVSFEQLWTVFTSHDYLVENPSLASGIAQAICTLLMDSERRRFLLRYLPGIPVRLSDVSGFKDMMKAIMVEDGCPTECVSHAISLVNGWCQEDWQHVESDIIIKWITSGIPLQGSVADMRTIESFRSLINTVLESEYKVCKPAGNIQKLLRRFYKLATSRGSAATTELESDDASSSLTPVFVGACLRFVWEHREELDESKMSAKDVQHKRDKVSKSLRKRLDRCNTLLQQDGSDRTKVAVSLATTLQILGLFDDIAPEKHERFTAVGEDVSSDVNLWIQKITRRRRIARSAASEAGDLGFNDPKLLEGVDLRQMQASEQQYFARSATAKLKHMNNTARVQAIRSLKNEGFEGPSGASRLLLVGLAVSVVDEIAEKDSTEAREVSSLFTAVTQVLQKSREIEHFSLAAECVDIILRVHPRGVSQFNIDNFLAAVSTTMSSFFSAEEEDKETGISPEFASTRLCRLLGTIAGLYRQQLGGRFHILIPALQSLLRALFFAPGQSHSNKVRSGGSVSNAVLFTRLLTSLCDPTLSSVSRPSRPGHARDGLVDQTKKAKVISGQHARILIQSYAHNMLQAPLKPEIKNALAPGLYAVLDAMPTESKRALNASLDVSARAIFKTLHEDYVRFGKWNSR
jgi:nucleolar pre-ribosomal-associated protein 2